jgi:hypothetical protein
MEIKPGTFQMRAQVQKRMQKTLNRFEIPLVLCWKSDNTKSIHGELRNNVLFIYDENENDAWDTFIHEIFEFKLKRVTIIYRTMINSLISGYEKLCYERKEEFLESLPKVIEAIQELKSSSVS